MYLLAATKDYEQHAINLHNRPSIENIRISTVTIRLVETTCPDQNKPQDTKYHKRTLHHMFLCQEQNLRVSLLLNHPIQCKDDALIAQSHSK